MRYVSTRGAAPAVSLDRALLAGLAPDGGLYVPERIPSLGEIRAGRDLAATARTVLEPFFAGSALGGELDAVCGRSFDVPAPLRPLAGGGDRLLELFHGPTAAFKDYAARFLAEALSCLGEPATLVVATSGDTGAAVAAAFHRRPGFQGVILYPEGRIAPRQAHSLECWGDNVRAFRVAGSFDDCQRLAKQALADAALRERLGLTSANSISLGRLLPQLAYHAHAACRFLAEEGARLNLIVPTGNLGNASAAVLARLMGLPVGDVVLATNANDVLPRYFRGEPFRPRPARATLANAMDVGSPSNFERLRAWHRDDAELRAAVRAFGVEDGEIREAIRRAPHRHGIVPCPHTATGLHALDRLRAEGDERPWAVVATAHPAKFDEVVEPLVEGTVEVPPALEEMLSRPARGEPLPADFEALRARLLEDLDPRRA